MDVVPGRDDCESIPIAMGGYLATIRTAPAIASVVKPMLRDVMRADPNPPGATVDIRQDAGEPHIYVDGRLWDPGPDQTLCDQLLYALMMASLDAEPHLLHLHAAYVASEGRGLLLSGNRGAGKSTLVARLVGAGFDYLTDERIGVDTSLRISAFFKPVSLVSTSFSLLSHLDPGRTEAGAASPRLWHVPATTIRQGSAVDEASLAVIAFVGYRPGRTVEVSEVHPAEAARLLLSDSVDAVRFGSQAVPLVARLCTSVSCVRVVFGDSDEVPETVRSLLLSPEPVHPSIPVRKLHSARGGRRHRGDPRAPTPAVSEDVSGVVIGDRALVYRKSTGEVIELDAASTAWIQLLDGRTPLGNLAREIAVANDMSTEVVTQMANDAIARLNGLGVLA